MLWGDSLQHILYQVLNVLGNNFNFIVRASAGARLLLMIILYKSIINNVYNELRSNEFDYLINQAHGKNIILVN